MVCPQSLKSRNSGIEEYYNTANSEIPKYLDLHHNLVRSIKLSPGELASIALTPPAKSGLLAWLEFLDPGKNIFVCLVGGNQWEPPKKQNNKKGDSFWGSLLVTRHSIAPKIKPSKRYAQSGN